MQWSPPEKWKSSSSFTSAFSKRKHKHCIEKKNSSGSFRFRWYSTIIVGSNRRPCVPISHRWGPNRKAQINLNRTLRTCTIYLCYPYLGGNEVKCFGAGNYSLKCADNSFFKHWMIINRFQNTPWWYSTDIYSRPV